MNRTTWLSWRVAHRCGDTELAAKLLEQLVADNGRLVYQCGYRLLGRSGIYAEHLEDDVFQAGFIGLLRAIEKWDPTRGKFSTLAHYEIRYEMQRVLSHATTITRPRRVVFGRDGDKDAPKFVSIDEAAEVEAPPTPEDDAARDEELDLLEDFKATLTPAELKKLAKHDPETLRRAREFLLDGDEE